MFNLVQNSELEELISASKHVVCRGGYSTIMDMIHLNTPAFLVPTPGQWEQEYVCEHLKEQGVFNSSSQDEFSFENLSFYSKPNLEVKGYVYEELKRLESMLLKL